MYFLEGMFMLHKYYFEFEPFWTRQRSRNSAPFFPIDLVTCFRIPLLVISLFQSPNLNRIEKQVGIGEVGGGGNCSKKGKYSLLLCFPPEKGEQTIFFLLPSAQLSRTTKQFDCSIFSPVVIGSGSPKAKESNKKDFFFYLRQ